MHAIIFFSNIPEDYENVSDIERLKFLLKQRKNNGHWSMEEKKWINPYQEKLLCFLVGADIPACSLRIRPYQYKIYVYIDDPFRVAGGGGSDLMIEYNENEPPKEIAKKIALAVADIWGGKARTMREMLEGAKSILKGCEKFTGTENTI